MLLKRALPLVTALYCAVAFPDPEPTTLAIGDQAPFVSFLSKKKSIQQLDDVTDLRKYLIVFITSEVSNKIFELQSRLMLLEKQGVYVLAIDVDCFLSVQGASNYWETEKLLLPVKFDDGSLASLYKVEGVPFVAMIDENGILKYRGGMGETQKEKDTFFELAIKLGKSTVFNESNLNFTNTDKSFYPNCKGVR